MREIKVIGIVGAGTMGHGIAQAALQTGFQVLLNDVTQEILQRARGRILSGLSKAVEKGIITEAQKEQALANLTSTTALADLGAADFVIEAVAEDFGVKKRVFEDLDRSCRPDVILATNTSSISITKIAATTSNPARVIGMHFFNPPPLMRLVEIIRGLATKEHTVSLTRRLAEQLGKTPVEASDYPGFLVNRVLLPMINEAIYTLMEGVGTAEAIDTALKLGANHPMGPLALADFIGLDVCLAVLRTLHETYGGTQYRPCPLLVRMVDAGFLGQKTGRGFYTYDKARKE